MVTTGTLMKRNNNLTHTERIVLDKASRLLGDHLASLLLSGLGDTNITHCRAYAAQGSSPSGEEVTYSFEMRNDSAQGLPHGRDPLVLAVLLQLFVEQWMMDDSVRFAMSEIIQRLQWSEVSKSRLLITQAIGKYVSTAYCLLDSSVSEEERSSRLHLRLKRLLIDYDTTMESLAVRGRDPQKLIRVQFPSAFVSSIKHTRKHFLGIEFQTLRELKEIPCLNSGVRRPLSLMTLRELKEIPCGD